MKNFAVLLAGGSGKRTEKDTPKAFLKINDLYLLEYSLLEFSKSRNIDHIILVVPEEYLGLTTKIIQDKQYSKVMHIISGGNSRFESSYRGIKKIEAQEAQVLIHDTARPFVSQEIINSCIKKLQNFDAVNTLAPLSDSLVLMKDKQISQTLDRNAYRQVQTPQAFRLTSILKAHEQALINGDQDITDDYQLVLKYQTGRCSWIDGDSMNFKITYAADLNMAEKLSR